MGPYYYPYHYKASSYDFFKIIQNPDRKKHLEVTLVCNLDLQPSVPTNPGNDCQGTVTYRVGAVAQDMLFRGGKPDEQTGNRKYLIGQRLSAEPTPFWKASSSQVLTPAPSGLNPAYQWTIEGAGDDGGIGWGSTNTDESTGEPFKAFTVIQSNTQWKGQVVALAEDDLRKPALACCFASSSSKIKLSCTVHLAVPPNALPVGGLDLTLTEYTPSEKPDTTPFVGNFVLPTSLYNETFRDTTNGNSPGIATRSSGSRPSKLPMDTRLEMTMGDGYGSNSSRSTALKRRRMEIWSALKPYSVTRRWLISRA